MKELVYYDNGLYKRKNNRSRLDFYFFSHFLSLVLLFFSMSCSQLRDEGSSPISMNLNLISTELDSLHQYVSEIEMVQLGSESDPFVIPQKVLVRSNGDYLILSSGQVFEYSSEGTFKGRITVPIYDKEYVYINDFCLESHTDRLMCLTQHNFVLVIDLETNAIVKKIDSHIHGITGCAIIPAAKDRFSVLFLSGYDAKDIETPFYCLKTFNKRGRVVSESLRLNDFYLSFAQYSPAIQGKNNEYYITYSTSPGTSYVYKNGVINQWLNVSFGEENIPERFLLEEKSDPWDNINQLMLSDYYKCPFSVCSTDDLIFYGVYGPRGTVINYLYSTVYRTGIKWQSKGNAQPVMNVLASDESFFYFTLYEPNYGLNSDRYDVLKEVIYKNTGYVYTENSVPALFKIKFKLW